MKTLRHIQVAISPNSHADVFPYPILDMVTHYSVLLPQWKIMKLALLFPTLSSSQHGRPPHFLTATCPHFAEPSAARRRRTDGTMHCVQ